MRRLALIVLGLFALILATSSDAQKMVTIDPVAAASGAGTYTDDIRFLARLELCKILIDQKIDPEGLVTIETAHGFTKDAMQRTMEACVAYSTGMAAEAAALAPTT